MSSSWNCEVQLREMVEELRREAYELEQAADLLQELRNDEDHKARDERLRQLKDWAKDWIKRG